MRSLRWLLLVAIAVIAVGVFQVYRVERLAGKAAQRPTPRALSPDEETSAFDWEWGQSADGKPAFKLTAKEMRRAVNSKVAQLEGIELRLYEKDGKHYNRVRSDHAEFSSADNKLFAPGEAEVTLSVPVDGPSPHPLTSIKAARMNFDSQTGEAFTDQHVTFAFEDGSGICDGASYNPQTHAIHLLHGVVLNLKSKNPKGRSMKVESEELIYSETEATVKLGPWSKMTRDQTVLVAGASVLKLRDRKLESIEAPGANGTDKQAGRDLEYKADLVKAQYNDHGEMEKLEGTGNARLISRTKMSETAMTGDRVNLFFEASEGDSVLTLAQARGTASLESKPLPDPKGLTPDTKNLKSNSVDLFMKPGGKELDHVSTLAPGTLEFQPNQIARSKRILNADRMLVRYGTDNEIQSFHADKAFTETYPSQDDLVKKRKTAAQIARTNSTTLDASFDEKGQLKQMQQVGDFHYSEGVRKAQSDTAVMDNAKNIMDLDAHARVSDDAGSTAANHIRLDQATDEFEARGHVETTRLPDQKPAAAQKPGDQKSGDPKSGDKNQNGMLDPNEATQGKAEHLVSTNRGQILHYSDHAVVWQAGSRISGDRIDIDRKDKALTAEGSVVSQLQDSTPATSPGSKPVVPVTTLVQSQKLVYTDPNRLAVYSGGVTLVRSILRVKCATLQAYMNDGQPVDGVTPDSRIDHMFADGKVEIVQTAPKRQRIGTSDHAEYYTDEGKVTLTGGRPLLKDSVKGDSTGEKLTYFTDDDRLLINGAPKKQVEGHIIRGKS